MIDVLVITDGRVDCLGRTLESAAVNLDGDINKWWLYCDNPDPHVRDRLWAVAEPVIDEMFWHREGRQGFAGAISYAWRHVIANSPATHLFHLEDDFTFNRSVPLDMMASILDRVPYLAQLALRRQAWNEQEIAAGGVVELRPDEFHDRRVAIDGRYDEQWLEHTLFWTTNPSLIRTEHVADHPWPNVDRSEGIYTRQLLDAYPDLRFAYYGSRDSEPWVHHIGEQRVGTGY